MSQKSRILAFVVVALALLSTNPIGAQTNGEPLISTGGSSFASSPAYIDAYVETGGATSTNNDICLRIQSVYSSSLIPPGGGAVVDARGFTNTNFPPGSTKWVCTVNPFATTAGTGLTGKTGKLLLGYIDIEAGVTWVIPSQVIIEGIGANGTGLASANTEIHAASSFSAGLGSTTNPAVLQMGLGGTGTSATYYGIQIRDLTVNCNAVSSTAMGAAVGVLNNNAEERSLLNNVQIFDCPIIGLHVTTSNPGGTGFGAVNSGPYQDVAIGFTATGTTANCGLCGNNTVALQVDGDTTTGSSSLEGRSIRGFDNFTVSGNNLSISNEPNTLIKVFGVSTAITNSHVEFCSGSAACIVIGNPTASLTTTGVRLSDVTVGVNHNGYDVEILGNSTFPTGNVLIENLNHESTANTNTLQDNMTSNKVADIYLGWYFLGAGTTPTVFTSSTSLTNGGTPYALTVAGNIDVIGSIAKGSSTFKIDHPLNPANQFLYHSVVESPDMMNIYNGSVITDKHGLATVILPDYFEALNRDFRYQLTLVGQFAEAFVAQKVKGNRFVIKTSRPGVEVSWQVTGVRHDDYANQHRIHVEEPKPLSNR